jgi:acyl-CoA thioester hydrolase
MTNERPLEIKLKIPVRTYDIDSVGHVSNIAYFRWLEDMRLQLLEEHFPLQIFEQQGLTVVLAASSIEYKKSIKLFDKPVGHMWIGEIGRASFKFQAEIYVEKALTTRASHVGVFIDTQTGKPQKVPAIVRQKFREAQICADM